MTDFLALLPPPWNIIVPILALVAGIIMSIWGRAVINWGKKTVTFGLQEMPCSKCRQLMMVKSLKYKSDRELIRNSILRDQMNYAEMKLHEIFLGRCRAYREHLTQFRKPGTEIDMEREQKEYLIYQETISNAMALIKNELRRSFKENGFCEMSPVEYTQYVKEKTKGIITIKREYLMSRYPYDRMIVPLQYSFDQTNTDELETILFNVMDRAKEIFLDAEIKLEKLDKEYDDDIEQIGKNH